MNDIRLILDRSALLLFARGALPVGETLAEVIDEGDLYATPVTVYLDVMRLLNSDDEPQIIEMARLVRLLMASPSARLLPVLPGDVDAILHWTGLVGYEQAACVVAMLARPGCYVLTGEPEFYEGELGEGSVIRIED